jgi:acetylornithine deacetylase/succinyl-diaminopimelate desuccinylase family protein
MTPSRDEILALLSELVGIESVNPSLVAGGSGEEQIASYVCDWLRKHNVESELEQVAPGRFNAVGRIRGARSGPTLMLNAHLDTVGLGSMIEPLKIRVDGDRAFGRGAYDMKGSLAAIMLAAGRLASDPPDGEVIIAGVADEEHASLGTQELVKSMSPDAAIITEPTGLRVCVAHKGFAWIHIEATGRAAHGSRPDLGRDAILAMGSILGELQRLEEHLRARPAHPLLGTPSVHASLIEGGEELSSYPASCKLQVERRTLPGEIQESVAREFQEATARGIAGHTDMAGQSDLFFWRDAFEAKSDSKLLHVLKTSIASVTGREPEVIGEAPWMDSALTEARGIATVVFGPGGAGAHSDEEWVSLSDIAVCVDVLADVARRFCRDTTPS